MTSQSPHENKTNMSKIQNQGKYKIGGQWRRRPYSPRLKDSPIVQSNTSYPLFLLASLLNAGQRLGDEEIFTGEDDDEGRRRSSSKDENCKRSVFLPSQEARILLEPEHLHYFIASKLFYQRLMRIRNPALPRKTANKPWNALNSVVYIRNPKLETQFEARKSKFKTEGKVNAFGDVEETMVFHGTSNENLNQIVENNFSLDHLPTDKEKLTFFGRGIYFSPLPGVSLMYGTGLLLCKVILGKCERYYSNGSLPPEIPKGYDSRVIMRDGEEIVTVVKQPAQILPYCCLNIKQDRIEKAGAKSKGTLAKMMERKNDFTKNDPATTSNTTDI